MKIEDWEKHLGRGSASPAVRAALELLDPKEMISSCESDVRTQFRGLLLVVAMLGMGRVRVICGRRTAREQQKLWGMGRTKKQCRLAKVPTSYAQPGIPKVTWIDPLLGRHVAGRAIDIDVSCYRSGNYDILGHAARSVGVTWGGDWTVKDCGHFEV